jgi:hypothetical protein
MAEAVEEARKLITARTDDLNHTTAAAARTSDGRIVTGVKRLPLHRRPVR